MAEPNWQMVGTKSISLSVEKSTVNKPTIAVSVDNQNPHPNDTVNVTVMVKAGDEIKSGTLALYIGGKNVKSWTVPDIPAGGSQKYTYSFTPAGLGYKGGDSFDVGAQGEFSVGGQQVTVNSNVVTIDVAPEQALSKPAVSVSVTPQQVNTGQSVTITLTVKNPNSVAVSGNASLTITLPDGTKKTVTPTGAENFQLDANGSKSFTYDYSPDQAGTYYVKGSATITANGQQASNTSGVAQFTAGQPTTINVKVALSLIQTTVTAGDTVSAGVEVDNNSNVAITKETVKILVDGNPVASQTFNDKIPAGGTEKFNLNFTASEAGEHTVTAEVDATFETGKEESFTSNPVSITVKQPGSDSYAMKLTYPSQEQAGDAVTITVEIINNGQNTITGGTVSMNLNQLDASGNTVATFTPTVSFGNIAAGGSDSKVVIVTTKATPGTLSGSVSANMSFSDGKSLQKNASISITLTGQQGGGQEQTSGSVGQILNYLKTRPLIAGGIVAGVALLLLLGRRRPAYAYPPVYPAYPPAYPGVRE